MDDLEKFSNKITYHPESGKFSWKTESRFNEPFTCNHPGGYLNGGFLGKTYYAHRVAWLMYYGEWPEIILITSMVIKGTTALGI